MARRRIKRIAEKSGDSVLPFPYEEETWARVVMSLGLPRQQARVVEGILRGKGDKQIAQELGLGVPTVRTYLGRVFDRLGASDRVQVVLRVIAQERTVNSEKRGTAI